MKPTKSIAMAAALLLNLGLFAAQAQEKSRYMGGEVTLKTAPNGAVVNAAVLETAAKIVYLEPVTEKVADGVWCIGGHSVGNTTVIEAADGLIVYDTGDNKEEGEHLREAIAKISEKPIKAIIYSHSHYALGAGALVDNPDDVLVIGHPKLNETVQSSLQGGGSPSARLLIGPNWSGDLPDGFVGADIVRSPSDFAGALARVALTDDTAEELKIVNGIQDGITVMALSAWIAADRKDVKAEDVPLTKGNYPTYPGMEKVPEPGRLSGLEFLRWVSLVLNDPSFTKQTDGHKEIEALARFERLGLKAGTTFDPEKLTPAIKAAVEQGIEDARKEVMARIAEGSGVNRNGWDFSSDLGYKDTDWVERARYGLIAVLAPVPSRSHLGTFCLKDSEGRPLSGEHRYTITFDLKNMPPVTEFWEMPLYDTESYFYDNPIDRYSLNSYMLERGKLHTEDDKLVIYVQHDEPTDPKQRQNWLPAPKDGFQFTARFYGPATSLIDGSYDMPGVERVD